MPLKMSALEFRGRVPELPSSMPVFALSAQSLDERREAIGRLGDYFRLGAMKSVEFDHAIVMASPQGDIHYFPASGAVLARDATAGREEQSELRRWDGLDLADDDRMVLNPDLAQRLIELGKELLAPIGLLGDEPAWAAVQLDQVAHLDGEGKEIERGAGQATIKFGYAVEGRPVYGAGAKTLAFAEPGFGEPYICGAFHVWRRLGKAKTIRLPGIERALGVGLLSDPELDLYHQAGHKIQITRLDFGYLALPAFMRQSHLFPAFQIEGEVSEGERGKGFLFARYHHAVPPTTYAKADLVGPYLTINPDGITPLPTRRKRA